MREELRDRRAWLQLVGAASTGALLVGCRGEKEDEEKKGAGEKPGEDVSPAEDLMREHGLLNRVLLIYDESARRLEGREELKPEALGKAAGIIRHFIEDYHEKLEEEHLFPRFEKAGKLTDLVATLRAQHQAGRALTEQITSLATLATLRTPGDRKKLAGALRAFNRMYRPHESREDTVLFPAFHQIVTPKEYDALGDQFEEREHQLFGEEGFEKNVDEVAGIEKELGIYELAQFTPKV
jgi:hemerythrin-like domain-containing protein